MFAQRSAQQALRRLATARPTLAAQMMNKSVAAPLAVAGSMQTRVVSTETISTQKGNEILANQRKQRPVSPHLSIYKPQITWIGSSLNRITGVALAGGAYVFGLSYLAAPLFGWHLESATLAAGFAAWPLAAKILTKFSIALPFTYHGFNGIRHLIWDTGRELGKHQVIRTGWAVVGASVASAIYLAGFI